MNTRPSQKSLTESHHHAQMRTLRVIAAALTCIVFVHPVIADIPGATLAQVTNLSAPVHPRSLAAGADGKIWFSDEGPTLPHSVGYFTSDGHVTKFSVPCDQCNGSGDRLAYIESIAVGPDGNGWFPYTYVNGDGSPLNGGMNSFIGRFTPAGQFTSFPVPTIDAFRRFVFGSSGHSSITSGPDGNLWFTENSPGKIGKITTAGIITEYPLASTRAAPVIITKGPDGNLWFTEFGVGKIGRITPAGAVSEFSAPRGPVFNAGPFGLTAGPDGNMWYTDTSGAIGRVTPGGVVSRFDLEPNAIPNMIMTGADGKLYFCYNVPAGTSFGPGKVAQFDPATVSAFGGPGPITANTATVNTALLPGGALGSEFAHGPGSSTNYLGVEQLDMSGNIFVDQLWDMIIKDPCVPPPTISYDPADLANYETLFCEAAFGFGFDGSFGFFVKGAAPKLNVSASAVREGGLGGQKKWDATASDSGKILVDVPRDEIGTFTLTVTVTDANNCSVTLHQTITISICVRRRAVGHH